MRNLNKLTIDEYIKDNTITDKEKIRIAISMPKSTPDSFIPKKLEPVGIAKFRGDSMPENWGINKHFTIGKYYPVYEDEGEFIISELNGVGVKITTKAWSIKYF